jgi:MarR family transcriptional regulator, organic hydroperoxide resistance regulator
MVLWEDDGISVNEISQKLILNTNTVTPLLKRMESQGIIKRQRSGSDERKVIVELTAQGKGLKSEAASIPEKLAEGLISGPLNIEELIKLKDQLDVLINFLSGKNNPAGPISGEQEQPDR